MSFPRFLFRAIPQLISKKYRNLYLNLSNPQTSITLFLNLLPFNIMQQINPAATHEPIRINVPIKYTAIFE